MKTSFLLIILFVFLSCDTKLKTNSDLLHTISNTFSLKMGVKNIGDTLDVHQNVYVFYNKSMNNTSGRHVTKDGYNLGLKWQCVEYVKRFYYEHLNHKMPNTYGHAKDFFNPNLGDGFLNIDRDLMQFTNGSGSRPKLNDLVVFDGNTFNPYGHVAIISKVEDEEIEIVQQNVGRNSRDTFELEVDNGIWTIEDNSILGWLRKK